MFHIDPITQDICPGENPGRWSRMAATSNHAVGRIAETTGFITQLNGQVAVERRRKVRRSDTKAWAVAPPARYYSPAQIVQGLAQRAGDQGVEDSAQGSRAMLLASAEAQSTNHHGKASGEDERDDDIEFSSRLSMVLAALTDRLYSRSGDKVDDPDLMDWVIGNPPYSGHKRNLNWMATPGLKTEYLGQYYHDVWDIFEAPSVFLIALRTVRKNTEVSNIPNSTWAMSGLGKKRFTAPAYPTVISEIVIPIGSGLTDSSPSDLLDYYKEVFPRSEESPEPFIQFRGSVTRPPAPVLKSPPRSRVDDKRRAYAKAVATESAQSVPHPPLLTEVGKLIQGWTNLSDTRRRDLQSAVSAAMSIDAIPDPRPNLHTALRPATMSCAYLNTRLFRQPHAIYGIKSPKRFSNILSELRFLLSRLGGHEPPFAAHMLSASWQTLYEPLTLHRRYALQKFMQFCSAQFIEPEAVTANTLAAFEAWLLERTLCRDAPVRARGVASNWTWARAHLPGWPDVELKRPRMRVAYVRPFTDYPAALQADAKRFLDRLSFADAGDIFPDNVTEKSNGRAGLSRALKPRTIAARSFQLRQCLAAMVIMGRDPASITSLQQLVDPPEQAHAIMKFFLDRARNRQTSQTRNIGEVLRQLANYHCNIDPDAAARIARWARRASPKVQFSISQKNDERVRALLQPHVTTALLRLPGKLMKEAAASELRPHEAARLALYASVLAILFAFPMRRSNLAALRIDQHLLRVTSGGKLIDHIALPASETKNAKDMLWEIPEKVGEILQTYLERYRPHLTTAGNPYLFPQMNGMEGRSAHDLAVGLKTLVEGRIGCAFNIHLVRHFVVALFLRDHPGHYDDARKLLGHAATSYTIAVYAPWDVATAARSLQETLTRARAGFPRVTIPPASRRLQDRSASRQGRG